MSCTKIVPDAVPLLISEAQAAKLLGISPRTLWTFANRGDVPMVRLGNRRLYSPAALAKWIAERQSAAPRS